MSSLLFIYLSGVCGIAQGDKREKGDCKKGFSRTLLPDHLVRARAGQRHDAEDSEDGQVVGPRLALLVPGEHLVLAEPLVPLPTFIPRAREG